jgi:hypothetical protein
MQEIDVVRALKSFLRSEGLLGKQVTDLYIDAHPTLLIDPKLEPFQRFTLQFDSFALHPDIVGRLDDGTTTFAIEAKGADDWIKGIAQADIYRQGFHASLIAVAGLPSDDLRSFARQRGIGVIAVQPQGPTVIERPPVHLPLLHFAESVRTQFAASGSLLRQFYFNIPTHYLSCAACLRVWEHAFATPSARMHELEPFVRTLYPSMPADFRPALSGAEKLGLVTIQGNSVQLTHLGRLCAELLPDPLQLHQLHGQAKKGPIAELSPQTGTVLRMLLNYEPIAAFIRDVLTRIGPQQAVAMPTLVENASRYNKTMTPTVFFFPKRISEITDDQGFIIWRNVQPHDYRTTIYMQYKKILIHAGLLKDHGGGGTSSKTYTPAEDMWELRV